MKFDMAIISLVLIFYLHNLYRGFSEEILENINHFMNIIIRYCKNKTSYASTKAENRHSNSYFLFLPCNFVYLKIPINDPIDTEAETRNYNIQPKAKTQINCKHLADASFNRWLMVLILCVLLSNTVSRVNNDKRPWINHEMDCPGT